MLKKSALIVIMLLMVMVVYGCKNDKNGAVDSINIDGQEITVHSTRSFRFIRKSLNPSEHPVKFVCSVLPMSEDEEVIKSEVGIKGNDMYVDTTSDEYGTNSVIITTDCLYTILHDEQTVIKTQITGDSSINPIAFIFEEKDITFSEENAVFGSDAFNGVTYEYEEFSAQDKIMRLYFEGEICKGIVLTEDDIVQTVVFEEYSSEVDNNKFNVPENYKLLDYTEPNVAG